MNLKWFFHCLITVGMSHCQKFGDPCKYQIFYDSWFSVFRIHNCHHGHQGDMCSHPRYWGRIWHVDVKIYPQPSTNATRHVADSTCDNDLCVIRNLFSVQTNDNRCNVFSLVKTGIPNRLSSWSQAWSIWPKWGIIKHTASWQVGRKKQCVTSPRAS